MDSVQSSLRTFSLPILIALLYCLFTYNLLLDPVWTGWQLIGEVRLLENLGEVDLPLDRFGDRVG